MTTNAARSLISGRVARMLAGVAAAGAMAMSASADPIFVTGDPDGGFFGYLGFDVFTQQSVAARFTPMSAYTLDKVSIWFMSNDFDGTTPQTVTVSVRTDVNPGGEYVSAPSTVVLEMWTMDVPVVGWTPALIDFNSVAHPALAAGQKYWIVAESAVGPGVDPIWVWSGQGNEFTATNSGGNTPWQSGSGAAIGVRVAGTAAAVCRPDFDHNGTLGVADIFAFLNVWLAGGAGADFDGMNGLQVADIFAFLNAWFAGC